MLARSLFLMMALVFCDISLGADESAQDLNRGQVICGLWKRIDCSWATSGEMCRYCRPCFRIIAGGGGWPQPDVADSVEPLPVQCIEAPAPRG